MSGAEAANGAWPANADHAQVRKVLASKAVAMRIFMVFSPVSRCRRGAGSRREARAVIAPDTTMGGHVERRRRLARRDLGGRRCRGGKRLPEREPHSRNLLLLVHDDFLGDTAKLFVLAVAQLGERHVDGALMVRDHH